jgi:hypothetical protein
VGSGFNVKFESKQLGVGLIPPDRLRVRAMRRSLAGLPVLGVLLGQLIGARPLSFFLAQCPTCSSQRLRSGLKYP